MKNKTYKSSVTLGVTALSLIAIGLSGIAAAAGISYFGAESSAITPPAVDPSSVTPIVEVPTTTNSPFTPPPQTAVGAYYAYYTCLYVGVTCLVVAGGLILYAFITSDPAVQQVAPAVQQVAPAVQQVAPAVQQVAPAVQPVSALTVTAMETGAKLSESAVQGIAKQVAMIPKTIMDSFNTVFPLCQDGTVAYPNNFGSQGYKMAAECYKRLCSAVARFVAERGLSPIVEQIARVSWAKNALESWSENPTLLNKDLLFKTINYDRIKPEVVVKTYTVVLDFIRGYARVAYAVFSKNN